MEGKQEDRDSPLDFPSAARADERRRLDHERLALTISPPTIPRSTSDFDTGTMFRGWQSSGVRGHAISPARSANTYATNITGASTTTSDLTRSSATSARSNTLSSSFSRPAPTSAFSSSRSRQGQLYGQIPAYHQEQNQENVWSRGRGREQEHHGTSSSSSWLVGDQQMFDDRRPQHVAPRRFVASGGTSAPPSQGRFFTPLPAAASDPNASRSFESVEEDMEENFPSPRREFMPHSAASIQTMGSIDESIPSPSNIDAAQTRGASLFQIRKTRSAGAGGGGAVRSSNSGESEATMRRTQSVSNFTRVNRGGSTRSGRSEARSVSAGRSSRASRRGRGSISPAMTPTMTPTGTSSFEEQNEEQRGQNKKSPPPQNLRGDPFRSAKVKTEICRNFMSDKGCPFGDKCNYAHGENELKFTKLMDLERAGLVDVEIFRTHPCPTWVATGTCPFDQRCIGLHDPRIEGKEAAWLPHAETMINKIADGVNVDNFYHERVASVYNMCPVYGYVPLVPASSHEENAGFKHFYDFICNADRHPGRPGSVQGDTFDTLSEEAQLQIVLKTRQEKVGASYTYMPTHLLQGELCMVLQTKTFESRKTTDGAIIVRENDNDSQQRIDTRKTKIHEIAFGPVGDVTVRTVTVWFDIPDKDLVECTAQQAKHHKRSRHRLNKKVKNKAKIDENNLTQIPPFDHYQPRDDATFELVTSILLFRLKTITLLRRGGYEPSVKQQIIHELETEMETIKIRFYNLLRHWFTWSWPDQVLQVVIDDDTDVPPVDGEYYCPVDGMGHFPRGAGDEFHGLGTNRGKFNIPMMTKYLPAFIWKSFLQNSQIMQDKPVKMIQDNTRMENDEIYFHLRRLPIFRHLSLGGEINESRNRPNIRKVSPPSTTALDIEKLFDKWESTREHYTDNVTKRRSKSDSNHPPQDEESLKNSMSRHLEACAAQVTRTF